jgi:hypothetical protein
LDETGALSPYQAGVPTPYRLSNGTPGQHTLFSLAIPTGLVGKADFYAAFGQSGVDILSTPGALDMASIQQVSVTLKEAAGAVPDGRSLYAQHCAACHGVNPLYNAERILNGRDTVKTQTAISQDKGGMGYLSFLTDTNMRRSPPGLPTRYDEKHHVQKMFARTCRSHPVAFPSREFRLGAGARIQCAPPCRTIPEQAWQPG